MTGGLPAPTGAPAPTVVSPAAHDCGSCSMGGEAVLERRGRALRGAGVVVALAGNPNAGKTTLFNALTGLRQRVGNWPGTTVSRAEGAYRRAGTTYRVVDLPGSSSLMASTGEELVAREFLLHGRPDVCVVVVDATRLERNLYLVLQLLQVTRRVVVALTMIDEVERAGRRVDTRHLARELGVRVVPVVARRSQGLGDLVAAVALTAAEPLAPAAAPGRRLASRAESAARAVSGDLDRAFPGVLAGRWLALRLLEGDPTTEDAVLCGRVPTR